MGAAWVGEDVGKPEASCVAAGAPGSAAILENDVQFPHKLNRILYDPATPLLVFTQEK